MKQKTSELPLFNWLQNRAAGVLLHPTCLPSDQGIGVLNQAVDGWLAFLSDAGIRFWQICPLGPTGYGDSPYQCFSAFAGNPYLIDLHALVQCGLLTEDIMSPLRALPRERVDYGWLYVTKWPALLHAYDQFAAQGRQIQPYGDFDAFQREHQEWLEPYALFLALKDHFKGAPWWTWPADLRFYRDARSSDLAQSREVRKRAEAHAFFQYLFFGQWRDVRARAKARNIEIIGDAPIFVARDSADVWSNPDLFELDDEGLPRCVAGVPPDYFSADGQLWGNPLYDWPAHTTDGYKWWLRRLRATFELYDVVRIDHFRGFDTYWSIPAGAPTAKTGSWEQGPGLDFFRAVKAALPECRLIAEDLGDLLPSVLELRDNTGLPGMTVLQFAFGGGSDNLYLPHNTIANSVVYPGTHDNDTTLGWYRCSDEKTRDHVRRYFRVGGQETGWDFIRAGYASVARLAVFPAGDLMNLGSEARFNTPGKPDGNWQWRYLPGQLEKLHRESAVYLHQLGELYGR